jgi:hypothetical protein
VNAWSYFAKGAVVGPLGEDQLLLAAERGEIDLDTLVYTDEFGPDTPENWKQLGITELADKVSKVMDISNTLSRDVADLASNTSSHIVSKPQRDKHSNHVELPYIARMNLQLNERWSDISEAWSELSRLQRGAFLVVGALALLMFIVGLRNIFGARSGEPPSSALSPDRELSRLPDRESSRPKAIPLQVSKSCRNWSGNVGCMMWLVTITSMEDGVTIKDAVVNRGNCRIVHQMVGLELVRLPFTLKFGMSFLAMTPMCDPVEVQVTTDQDSFRFTFAP